MTKTLNEIDHVKAIPKKIQEINEKLVNDKCFS